jgi:hypothetical protein
MVHEKIASSEETGGANRAILNPSISAAPTSNIPQAQHGAPEANDSSASAFAKHISGLFHRNSSPDTSVFQAGGASKLMPTGVPRDSGPPHAVPLPTTSSIPREKAGASQATGSTPFDAPELLSSLLLDPNSVNLGDRCGADMRDDGDALFSNLFMIPNEQKKSKSQLPPAPEGAAAKGFSVFHDRVNPGAANDLSNANARHHMHAQGASLFPEVLGSSAATHAAQVGRSQLSGVCTTDRMHGMRALATPSGTNGSPNTNNSRSSPHTLQGIAQQVAASGLSGNGVGVGGARSNTANVLQSVRQQPVESPFGGPPGTGMGWQLGSGELLDSFDPLIELQLLDSRPAEGNTAMFGSQAMAMDFFSSFAASLDAQQVNAAFPQGSHFAQGPAATPGQALLSL